MELGVPRGIRHHDVGNPGTCCHAGPCPAHRWLRIPLALRRCGTPTESGEAQAPAIGSSPATWDSQGWAARSRPDCRAGGREVHHLPRTACRCGAAAAERFQRWPWPRVTVQEDCRNIHLVGQGQCQFFAGTGPKSLAMLEETGGALVSTGVVKSPGACRGGSFPRKSSCKTLVANDDNYAPVALAA